MRMSVGFQELLLAKIYGIMHTITNIIITCNIMEETKHTLNLDGVIIIILIIKEDFAMVNMNYIFL